MAVYIPAGELESRVFIYNNFHYWSNKNIYYKFLMAFRMYVELNRQASYMVIKKKIKNPVSRRLCSTALQYNINA